MNFQKLKLNKHFFFSLFTAVGIGLFVSAIFVSAADWTAPPASPPTCPDSNPACNTPLNVSASTQSKIGALGIGGVFEAFSDAFFDGKVGIGAGSPYLGSKLNVGGIGSSYSAIYGTHDTIGVYGRGTNVDGGGRTLFSSCLRHKWHYRRRRVWQRRQHRRDWRRRLLRRVWLRQRG